MLELLLPSNSFHKKCGEIFYNNATDFNVVCNVCSSNVLLEKFALHFRIQHLTLDEDTINIDELDRKRKDKLATDAMLIKQEDPIYDDPSVPNDPIDPIESLKQEQVEHMILEVEIESALANYDSDDDDKEELDENKCLMDLIKENRTKCVKSKTRKSKKTTPVKTLSSESPEDPKATDVDVKDTNEENICKDESDVDDFGGDNDQDKDWALDDEKDSDNEKEKVDSKNVSNEQQFPCIKCNKSYKSKRCLRRHENMSHNPDRTPKIRKPRSMEHKCEKCDKLCRSARDLKAHLMRHDGLKCDECGKTFTQLGNLLQHKKRHSGIKEFKCQDCPKEFFTDQELKAHSVWHTGILTHICEVCGKKCRDGAVLKAHMRRHTGERPAKCEVCGKCFYDGYDLNVHAVTHTSERPFECDICGSTFQRKKALRLHKRIHDKDRKYECKICGKAFAQSGGLNSHIRNAHNAAMKDCMSPTTLMMNKPAPVSNQILLNNESLLLAAYMV